MSSLNYLLVSLLCLHVAHVQCKNLSKLKTVTPQGANVFLQALQFSRQKNFQCEHGSDCPPWAVCNNRSTCTCLQNMPYLDCADNTLQIAVMMNHCVTYNNSTRELHTGLCIENCYRVKEQKHMHLPLPIDPLEMNEKMCGGHWNREGQLCGKCKPGHAPLVFSYELKCVSCSELESKRNLWIFLLIALGPSTIFFFIVMFFKINTTKSHLHGYLLFSQAVSMPLFVREAWLAERDSPIHMAMLKIFMVFYSVWNLDILKGVYPEICLDVSTLTVLSLEYIVALYPLALVVVSYILITLHDQNYRVVVLIWRPFRCIFTFFRRNWDIRSTVIDAYASFFQLSFLKIVGTSCDLLVPIIGHKINRGEYTWSYVMYYDGSVEFLSHEHLQYAIPAFALLLVFCIIPTLLLLLYPFRCFQVLLSTLRLRSQMLQAVMDSFQGYYKDGTEEGTRDFRWFSAVPLLVCYTFIGVNNATQDGTFYPIASAITALVTILIAVVQPYKKTYANYQRIEIIFWGFIACFYSLIAAKGVAELIKANKTSLIINVLIYIIGIIPFSYISCITAYWIVTRARLLRRWKQTVRMRRGSYQQIGDDSLPDRVSNPTAYESNPGHDAEGLASSYTGQDLKIY